MYFHPWYFEAKSCLLRICSRLSVPLGVAALIAFGYSAGNAAAAEPKIVVYDLEMLDSSHEGELRGPREDEALRIAAASQYLRETLKERGMQIVQRPAEQVEFQRRNPIRRCNGCEARLAREAGADLAIAGVVQKVSNLILEMTIYVRDATSREIVKVGSTSIRGNTDESWLRGVGYIVRNRLSGPPLEGEKGP